MKYTFAYIYILIFGFSLSFFNTIHALGEGDRIDMSVSPIRDEFMVSPGTPITRSLQYSNNSNIPYTIYITVEDCVPSGNYGTPICKLASGSGINSEFSSTWITLNEKNFTVPAKTTKTITYTINPPVGAAPGGHYGAIFFNNPNTPSPATNTVGMIRRIGMLYMMNIPGNIIVDSEIGDILVDNTTNQANQTTGIGPDIFNSAPSDIKYLLNNWKSGPMWKGIGEEFNPFWKKPTLPDTPFVVTLQLPVKNDGNIHIRPNGKVFLYDENGEQLKKIGKESVIDENGVYIGETIVDYLPINDEHGNVLPNTERTFQMQWLGFGYEERDPTTGKIDIKFESPGSYYTRLTEENTQFIYPWERLSIKKAERSITAKVEFSYNDITTGKDIIKNMSIPVQVEYAYISKGINYGMLILIGFIILLAWIFIRKRDQRIEVLIEENNELEDEITVLERAKESYKAKKAQISPKSKKERKKINPSTHTTEEQDKQNTKNGPVKKPTTKKTTKKTEDKS